MNRNFLFLIFFGFTTLLTAQSFDTEEFNSKRLEINQTGMKVLGAWALGNIAYSGIAAFSNKGENRAFHQMNVGWGAINLALAGLGYFGARDAAVDLSLLESAKELESMKRIFLFNAGLDLAYVAGGAYLLERSKNTLNDTRANQFAGFGKSIMLQGGFLFAFDLVMYYVHQNHGKKGLYNLVADMGMGPQGLYLSLNF